MGLVNSGFYMQKNLSESNLKFGHTLSRFASPVLGQKSLKNIGFKGGTKLLAYLGDQIINLPMVLTSWAGPI
jgi:hypothetical protein